MDSIESPSDLILSVAIPRPLDGLFTYRVPSRMAPLIQVGGWVRVPFGRSVTHAFVVQPPLGISELSAGLSVDSLKEIIEVGEMGPVFTPDVLQLCRWAHEYYCVPLGEILNCAGSSIVVGARAFHRKKRVEEERTIAQGWIAPSSKYVLTGQQVTALEVLESARLESETQPQVGLLHGVTGSGKTELYIELARRTLLEGKGVVILAPEIALTPQLHRRFEESLGVSVALWHSAVADGLRREQAIALRSGDLRIVVGARSAVFAPVQKLGLMIVDEEHDPAYKQEDRVRYQGRDLAIVRGKISKAFTLLGSATPSLESRQRVMEKKFVYARLPTRIAAGGMPKVEIIDLTREERVGSMQAVFAVKAIDALQEVLTAGEQAMIFLNRRGFANFLVCEDCGEVRGCVHCSISLTVHHRRERLVCHVCGYQENIPDFCSKCGSHVMKAIGAGTESLEEELPRVLRPDVPFRSLRLDRDQITSATRLERCLAQFRSRKANVLLGTQMLVKGHDFPGVTLVIVVLADSMFRWPDFRAAERALQVLCQVSGRAGRGDRAGRVLIQSYCPTHPVLQVIQRQVSEESFLESERQLRQSLGYPPFGRMARLRFEASRYIEAQNRSQEVALSLKDLENGQRIEILGPSEAFLERAKGVFRWDLLIKSKRVQDLQSAIRIAGDACRRRKWPIQIDVDPYGVG